MVRRSYVKGDGHLNLHGVLLLGGPIPVILFSSLYVLAELVLDQERGVELSHGHFVVCQDGTNERLGGCPVR